MATKKRKLSQAQLDALAKGRAAAAKKRKAATKKRAPVKRASAKRATTKRKTQSVKHATSKWVIMLEGKGQIGYFTGYKMSARGGFDTDSSKAAEFCDSEAALGVAKKITGVPRGYVLGVGKKV